MNIVIFAVLAFLMALMAVLSPRPVTRTAFLAAFTSWIFGALDVVYVSQLLGSLAVVLLVIDLALFREPALIDIGDRQRSSATLDDDGAIDLLYLLAAVSDRAAFYMKQSISPNPSPDNEMCMIDLAPKLEAVSDEACRYLIDRGVRP